MTFEFKKSLQFVMRKVYCCSHNCHVNSFMRSVHKRCYQYIIFIYFCQFLRRQNFVFFLIRSLICFILFSLLRIWYGVLCFLFFLRLGKSVRSFFMPAIIGKRCFSARFSVKNTQMQIPRKKSERTLKSVWHNRQHINSKSLGHYSKVPALSFPIIILFLTLLQDFFQFPAFSLWHSSFDFWTE